jgi:NDP-sugar pyrophosphorylase family protein
MKAMIFAAGLGTRLRPLTNDRPKALVEINGRTMLEITVSRLRSFGVTEIIINVHHHADMVIDYLKSHNNFGLRIEVSREELLLDTGGGLKKAAWFFLEKPTRPDFNEVDEPFLLHNVDVISTIDLAKMVQFHIEHRALATLAVQDRATSRYLLFDGQFQLSGRRPGVISETNSPLATRHSPLPHALAFSGIHIISPRLLPLLTEAGIFSIIDAYLRLAAQGHRILAFRADSYYWRDLGKPDDLGQASQDLQGKIAL